VRRQRCARLCEKLDIANDGNIGGLAPRGDRMLVERQPWRDDDCIERGEIDFERVGER
jgi:hypothetical protein